MAGSGVVFSKNGMMNDGGGHLYVLCTWCFVLGALYLITSTPHKVPSAKHKDQTLSQSNVR